MPAHNSKLTEGPIVPTLIKLTLPMILGIVSMVAFNLIDTMFVGRLGDDELAAISFTFPVVMVVGGIAMGLGIGISAVVSKAIGEKNQEKVIRFTTDGLLLALLIVAIFAIIGILTIDPLFTLLGVNDKIMPLVESYMSIWYLGVIFIIVPMAGNNAIRATGDTVTPSIIMITAVLTNTILDPLLIFGLGPFPRLELTGAAVATVIARAITFIVSLAVLYFREKLISFKIPKIHEILYSWKHIIYIGLPSAGTNIIVPFSAGIITRLVAEYGKEAVAAYGVGSRIEIFAITIIIALSSVLSPFIGQNLGAKKISRIKTAIKVSGIFSFGWGIFLIVIFMFLSQPIATIFNTNPVIISNVELYLIIFSFSYGLQGIFHFSTTAINVLHKPLHSAFFSLLRMIGIFIPLAFIGSHFFGLIGIFVAGSFANIVSGAFTYLWLYRFINKIKTN